VKDESMDVIEALDREVIVERAEEVRFWLLGLHLSSQATSAIQRELGAIIDNDPGTYINGQRPLAGLTVAEFIAELHRPNGGAVGRVKKVGYAALNELRARIPEGTGLDYAQPEPEPEYTAPELDAPEVPALEAATPSRVAPATEAPQAEGTSEVQPARRGPGRPKGSTKTKQNDIAAFQATDTAIAVQPSAPELPPAPAEVRITPVAHDGDDPMLKQIARLWPALHPHARRAVVMYVSALWAETATHEG
jgi:hypothetical protein